ncbi:unnamed protein product [Enterobius vermicularis]|uniref:BHLH domain-containing protein n=1 Tax=Enterobius vermicularis TaxID=51028 RepID=A0A3P6ITB3_ENTVE|nr:unnamed protein product [Enterobius vermicularis]
MRSTRGASKQRRDQINVEIQKLRDLLPLSESIKDRLFQLQVMSLACIFIRKQRYLPHIARQSDSSSLFRLPFKQYDGCKALRGFLLMVTKNGKMLYISENASEYLGHSVEEIMCQGDSLYDLVDSRDHGTVQSELMSGPPSVSVPNAFPDEKVFICRMNLSRTAKRQLQYHKFVLIEGRYLHPAEYYQAYMSVSSPSTFIQPVFAAYCQPLINPENAEVLSSGNTSIFRSLHLMDMKFLHIDDIGVFHLGYRNEDLEGESWYKLLHPAHLEEVAYKHRLLCQEKEGSVICLLRLQTCSGSWLWLHTVLAVRGNFLHQPQDGRRVRHLIYATYQLLSDMEVATLQANSWIYTIRHTYPPEFSCKDTDISCSFPTIERPLSSASPVSPIVQIKNEPFIQRETEPQNFLCDQIRVEIPSKIRKESTPANSFVNSENSSPESSRSIPTVTSRSCHFDEPPEICLEGASRAPLPELRDDLDEFFREVEYSPACDLNDLPKDLLLMNTSSVLHKDAQHSVLHHHSSTTSLSSMLNTPFDKVPSSVTPGMTKLFPNDLTNSTAPICGVYDNLGHDKMTTLSDDNGLIVKDEWYTNSGGYQVTSNTGVVDSSLLTCRRSRKRLASCAVYDLCVQSTH